jgi:prophage regulatory protein
MVPNKSVRTILKERIMTMANPSAPTIIRRSQVEARTGLGRSTIYQRVKSGSFPAPISLGAKAVGWVESEVDAWLTRQIEISRRSAA